MTQDVGEPPPKKKKQWWVFVLVAIGALLNGDAEPDFTFEQDVTCDHGGGCTVGPFVER